MSAWTPELTEKAKKLWVAGHSASEVSRALNAGISRNAVISKMHREKVAGPHATTRREALPPRCGGAGAGRKPFVRREPKPRAPKPVKLTRAKPADGFSFGSFGGAATGARKRPVEPKAPPAEIALAPRPWETRRFSGECAFPIEGNDGAVLSCCNATPETYCREHRIIMTGDLPKYWREFDKEHFARKVA